MGSPKIGGGGVAANSWAPLSAWQSTRRTSMGIAPKIRVCRSLAWQSTRRTPMGTAPRSAFKTGIYARTFYNGQADLNHTLTMFTTHICFQENHFPKRKTIFLSVQMLSCRSSCFPVGASVFLSRESRIRRKIVLLTGKQLYRQSCSFSRH